MTGHIRLPDVWLTPGQLTNFVLSAGVFFLILYHKTQKEDLKPVKYLCCLAQCNVSLKIFTYKMGLRVSWPATDSAYDTLMFLAWHKKEEEKAQEKTSLTICAFSIFRFMLNILSLLESFIIQTGYSHCDITTF